jgi:hypothetical protein
MTARKRREPWHPPQYDKADVGAIQALARGEAQPHQQKRVLDWIVNTAAQTYDEPYRPDSPDMVSYLLGRRSVGLAIVKLMKLNIAKVFKDD